MNAATSTETHWLRHWTSECTLREATPTEIAESKSAPNGQILATCSDGEHLCMVVPASLMHLFD
jgi:hypothetical protein